MVQKRRFTMVKGKVVVLATFLVALSTGLRVDAAARYQTTYQSVGGNDIDAIVEIDGADGTYTLNDGQQGTLSNLQLQNIGGQQVLRGNWSFGGANGTVSWRMDGTLDNMTGTWKLGNQTGSWNGSYLDGQGSIGNMGPVKLPKKN